MVEAFSEAVVAASECEYEELKSQTSLQVCLVYDLAGERGHDGVHAPVNDEEQTRLENSRSSYGF